MRMRGRSLRWLALCAAIGAACDGSAARLQDGGDDAGNVEAGTAPVSSGPYADAGLTSAGLGQVFTGGEYQLGPVDWDETQFHNACASEQKYLPAVRKAEGQLLAGVWSGLDSPQSYCDSCIRVQTDHGKSAVLRVVTYGDTTINSLDVSSEAYALLNSGEYPRTMTWQQVECPNTGRLLYELKTGSNAYWTALWVRNARLPIASVEVMSLRHAYAATTRDSDGSLVDQLGFGEGMFSIRTTSVDGQVVEDTFLQPTSGLPGALLQSRSNFE